jgi:hypothetical protein
LCKSREKFGGNPDNDFTSVRGRKREPYTGGQNYRYRKKARQMMSKLISMLIIFFDSRGLFTKNSTWKATYYCVIYGDWVKVFEDFVPNFGDKDMAAALREHFLFIMGTL